MNYSKEAIIGANFILGGFSKGYKVRISLLLLCLLKLQSLVVLLYAVGAESQLWNNIKAAAGQKMKEMLWELLTD